MKPGSVVVLTLTLTLAIVLTGCGGGTEQVEAPKAANGKPACSDIWAKGKTLPKDYAGCNRVDGSVAAAVFYDCKGGDKLASSSDAAALPGGAGDFFALYGGRITSGDANSPAYNKTFTKCMAS